MRHPRQVVCAMLVGLLVGSSGGCEEDEPETTCALGLSFTGDFTAASTEDPTCAIQHSFETGIDVLYLPGGSDTLKSVDLSIEDVTRGETGVFPATLRVRHSDDRVWQANGCTVTIDAHEARGTSEFGEDFRVAGSGECLENATDGAEGSLTIEPFDFVVVVTWRD